MLLAQSWLGLALARVAQAGLGRMLSVLPAQAYGAAESLAVYAPQAGLQGQLHQRLQALMKRCRSGARS